MPKKKIIKKRNERYPAKHDIGHYERAKNHKAHMYEKRRVE